MQNYFDILHDDLIMIVQIYLDRDEILVKFNSKYDQLYNKYINIYNKYIKDIQDGNINPYDKNSLYHSLIIKNYQFKIHNIGALYFRTNNDEYLASNSKYNMLLNTNNNGTDQLIINYLSGISNNFKNIVYLEINITRFITTIIYIQDSELYSFSNSISYLNGDYKCKSIKYEWKDLWNTLSLDSKNAILFDNNFPLIS